MERFRGGFPATIDAKGRVKLPARLREQLDAGFGREVYVCSFFPHELRVYPLPVWQSVEEQLLKKPAMKPAVLKLVERVNYGRLLEMDDQGRILVPLPIPSASVHRLLERCHQPLPQRVLARQCATPPRPLELR